MRGPLTIVVAATLTVAACSSRSETTADPADTTLAPATTATTSAGGPTTTTTTVALETTSTVPAATTTAAAATTEPPTPTTVEVAEPASMYPPQPDGVAWPTDEWPVADPPEGFDSAAADAAVDAAFGGDDNEARLRSIMAVQGGAIVYERYHPLDPPETILNSFSVAKSYTSAIVGLLVDDGVLDVDAPAPVDEWQESDDPRAAITLENLLHMASGLAWEEVYTPDGLAGQMFASPDWAEFVINQPLEADPGQTFEYSTGTTAALAEIVADHVGGPEELDAFMRAEMLEPLGIESTTFVEDPTGQFAGGLGFDSNLRDFARFGYLFLRGGEWDGEQILSTDWIDYSATPSPTLGIYGAQWWLDGPGGNMIARGLFGQYILVVPDRDLVIVATATSGGDSSTPLEALYRAFDDVG